MQLGVTGIMVLDARPGGPAAKAGIHGTKRDEYGRLIWGDIIQGFDGKRIRCPAVPPPQACCYEGPRACSDRALRRRTMSDLYKSLDRCTIGQEVDLELLREKEREHVKLQLQSS